MDNEQLIKQLSEEGKKVPDNRKLIISKAKAEGLIGLEPAESSSRVNNGGCTAALVKRNRLIAGIASAFVLGTVAAATIIPFTSGSFGGTVIPPKPPVGPVLCEEKLGNDYAVGAVSAAKLLGCFGITGNEATAKPARVTREAIVEREPDIETQIGNFGTYMGAFGSFFDLPEDMVGECTADNVATEKFPNAVVIMGRYANGEKADLIMRYLEALDVDYTGDGDKYYLEGEIFIDGTGYYLEGERTFITTDGAAEAYDLVLKAYPDAKVKGDYVQMTMGVREANGLEMRSYDYKVFKNGNWLTQTVTYLPSFEENKAFDLILNYGGSDSTFTVNKPEADKPILTVGYEIGTKRSSFKVSQKRGDAVAVVMKNFIYDLNETDKTCTVKGYKAGLELTDEELEIPDKIIIKNDDYTVTAIGESAFSNRSELKKIIIPSTVKTIGERAFVSCGNVETLELNEGLETIGTGAFAYCEALKALHLPASVKTLSSDYTYYNPFVYCKGLESITVAAGNSMYKAVDNCLIWYNGIMLGCVNSIIPNDGSIEYIRDYAFAGSPIKSVTIPSSIVLINSGAFKSCEELKKIVIHDNIDAVGYAAFEYCKDLTEITLPDKAISIGSSAFEGTGYMLDSSKWDHEQGYDVLYIGRHLVKFTSTYGYSDELPDMVIKNGTLTVVDDAFNSGYGIMGNYKSLTLNSDIELIGNATRMGGRGCREIKFAGGVGQSNNGKYKIEGNCIIDTDMRNIVAGCDASVIPQGDYVSAISSFAFSRCDFEEFVIPSNIKYIESYAFENSGIRKVTISSETDMIGPCAFWFCNNLAEVIFEERSEDESEEMFFPLRLDNCFVNCYSLVTVVLPKHLGSATKLFKYCDNLRTVYITMREELELISLIENCPVFESVIFDGTMADWERIYRDDYGLNFTVVCNDGTINPDIHQ